MSTSLYSQLPETAEMQLAKTLRHFQSQVGGPLRLWANLAGQASGASASLGTMNTRSLPPSGKVPRGRDEGGLQRALRHAARRPRDPARRGGVSAAERGTRTHTHTRTRARTRARPDQS